MVRTTVKTRLKLRWAASLLVILGGCGGSNGVGSLHPVTGRVTFDGAPLSSGEVVFVPDAGKGNKLMKSPQATIGTDGKFQLATDGKPGVPAGWYVVTVATQTPSAPPDAPIIPARYTRVGESGLTYEVNSTDNPQECDIKLTRK